MQIDNRCYCTFHDCYKLFLFLIYSYNFENMDKTAGLTGLCVVNYFRSFSLITGTISTTGQVLRHTIADCTVMAFFIIGRSLVQVSVHTTLIHGTRFDEPTLLVNILHLDLFPEILIFYLRSYSLYSGLHYSKSNPLFNRIIKSITRL